MNYSPYLDISRDVLTLQTLLREYEMKKVLSEDGGQPAERSTLTSDARPSDLRKAS